MIKYLTKHGNSHAFVIEQELINQVKATIDTPFEVLSDGRSIVFTPIHAPEKEEKFLRANEDLHQRFGEAMKKLAE